MSRKLRYTIHPGALTAPTRSIDMPDRLIWAVEVLDRRGATRIDENHSADLATLERAHDPMYLHGLRALSARGEEARLDPELTVDGNTFAQASSAAGAFCAETQRAVDQGPAELRFAASRPGSHHASRDFAMGLCLVNNLAVAACYALDELGLEHVAILDFDAHHGNGTQQIFWREPRVLTISMHQFPFFPGTGGSDEVGAGPGRGTNLNLPLAAGRDGRVAVPNWDRALDRMLAFAPQLVLCEAGFDAHSKDWTSELNFDDETFLTIGQRTATALAALNCPAVFELGGGYVSEAVSGGLNALIDGLGGPV
jgi:acetoin utilization deacetylase AcuC-like enzyme